MAEPSSARSGLPWTPEHGENSRFGLILLVTFLLFLPPALLIPTLEVPELDRNESEKVPPRLAKLVEQRQPPEPTPMSEPVPELAAERESSQDTVPEPEPEPETRAAEPAPVPPTRQTAEQARETASRSGLFAMRDQLAALRGPEPEPIETLAANVDSNAGSEAAAREDGSPVALNGSGGVAIEQAPTRAANVEGHQVREVAVAPAPEPAKIAKAEPGPPERGMSNIRKVFDAQKTALYSIYRRELRQDPSLEGKVLLELVIEPDGSVSHCEVVSSELDNPELETRIATRVRLFNFGSANVTARKVKFPIDFLPG